MTSDIAGSDIGRTCELASKSPYTGGLHYNPRTKNKKKIGSFSSLPNEAQRRVGESALGQKKLKLNRKMHGTGTIKQGTGKVPETRQNTK